MTLQERRSWTFLVVVVVAYAGYVIWVVRAADGGPIADVAYQKPLLISMGASMLAAIVIEILLAIIKPVSTRKDMRDEEIGRLGDYTGYSFVVIGGIAALLMSMAEWDWFWIANVLYLCFAVSAIFEGVAKVVAYRRGLPQW